MDGDICKYVHFKTLINASFWYKLTNIKLDVDRLTEARTHIWASYSNIQQKHEIPFLEIDCTSFNSEFQDDTKYLPCHGFVLNKNTVESFKDCDKLGLIDEEGAHFLVHFKSGRIFDDPSLLNTFFILTFADLKKYHYYFWFAFPTPSNFNVLEPSAKPAQDVFTPDQMCDLLNSYHNLSFVNRTFFVVFVQSNTLTILTLSAFKVVVMSDGNSIDVNSLYFGFSDPCVGSNPGWPMRNYMAFLYYCCPQIRSRTINVLSLRLSSSEQPAKYSCQTSLVLRVLLPDDCTEVEDCLFAQAEAQSKWIGWQKNERGNFGPKVVDMSSSMDPTRMMENSVNLNLKLMKWRLLPNIDLDRIKNTKCLLMGAGTLGCSVARSLLAWGVRHISFVDNGKVSYSNPVRQSLYTHADCVLGIAKVVAASASLRNIFPAVVSTGTQITIPMPGHSIGESLLQETQDSVGTLNELISGHDVVFLLTDSRESRWLPTLLAAHHQKIVINAALGFDTYLVMRHGCKSDAEVVQEARILTPGVRSISGRDLGCYFCNDITAPGDSMKDRTLDQQCTVTRPGVSAIAGALAAELAISILQHPNGPDAPAYYNSTNDTPDLNSPDECMLGIIPHSIRGFLSTFSHVLPATEHYQKCIACSSTVLGAYAKHGFDFLLQVFNSSKYLEDLTGLTELHQESDAAVIWEMSSSDEESDSL